MAVSARLTRPVTWPKLERAASRLNLMRILKRTFTLWLMLSVLGFGTVWAFDVHALFPEHGAFSQPATQDSQHDDDSADCDHSCHLGFHLLGILNNAESPRLDSDHRHFACSSENLTSNPRDPPVRPPRR